MRQNSGVLLAEAWDLMGHRLQFTIFDMEWEHHNGTTITCRLPYALRITNTGPENTPESTHIQGLS